MNHTKTLPFRQRLRKRNFLHISRLLPRRKKHVVYCLTSLAFVSSVFFRLQTHRFLGTLGERDPLLPSTPKSFDQHTIQRAASHDACVDEDINGVYHIAMGDIGGAAGTIFFQFVVAQIMYAERNGLKPWVHLSNVSHVIYDNVVHSKGPGVTLTALTGRNATYVRRKGGHRRDATPGPPSPRDPVRKQTLHFAGTGVWDHYFEPVSDFVPGDRSCEDKLYVTMDLYLITPGLHGYAEYAPRCWRYKYLPDYISKPHLGITEWLEPQRRAAHSIVSNYIRPRAYLKERAATVNPGCSLQKPCLGLHIRHSDKASGRRVVETSEFLPFAEAFLSTAGPEATIYLATDSEVVLHQVKMDWPVAVQARIRTAGSNVLRSTNKEAVFDLDGASHHHRANQEVLVEILALSECQFMVHGFSAVSESSIWVNLDLHQASVNLEDSDHLDVDQFKELIASQLGGMPPNTWVHPVTTTDVWPELYAPKVEIGPEDAGNNGTCLGYRGVLWISSVGDKSGAASAFFNSIMNQFLFAEMNNLIPWVHLKPDDSNTLILDTAMHDAEDISTSVAIKVIRLDELPKSMNPILPSQIPGRKDTVQLRGSGIWGSYFRAVSDFVPGEMSCEGKPILELPPSMSSGFASHAEWSIKAWRYDDVPNTLLWNETLTMSSWFLRMRRKGHNLIEKYYKFQPHLLKRAAEVNPIGKGERCLGLHLRNGEKIGKYREKISPKEFIPYIEAFYAAGGKIIYVSSDSRRAIQFLTKNLPGNVSTLIRTQGDYVVRSTKLDWPLHMIERHHRVNSEALVDVLALSKCHLLLHSFSTLSEATIYINPILQNTSVNMEDPRRLQAPEFQRLAKELMNFG